MRTSISTLKQLKLCSSCLGRQGLLKKGATKGLRIREKRGDGKDNLGVTVVKTTTPEDCEICEGRLSRLGQVASTVAQELSGYEFGTFLIGTTVPQTLIEKEDEIRSSLRIRGKEGLKTQITRAIGKYVAEFTDKKVDYARPDITVLVSLSDQSVSVIPRSIWVSARYTKKERGIPQKSSTCKVCNGLGCASCDFKGSDAESVQSIATDFFSKAFQGESCHFIWVGGEDAYSLVSGAGRPLFVEILRPRKRRVEFEVHERNRIREPSKKVNARSSMSEIPVQSSSSKVHFSHIEILQSKPTLIPMFKVLCEVHLIPEPSEGEDGGAERSIAASEIQERFRDVNVSVQMTRKFKRVQKHIDSIEIIENEDRSGGTILLRCDGGIPIKKLVVSSDDSVYPSLSPYIKGYTMDESKPFDILEVNLFSPGQTGIRTVEQSHRCQSRKNDEAIDGELPSDEIATAASS